MAPSWLEKFITREDATPDTRRSLEQPILEIHYTAIADHRRILGVKGDAIPRYEVQRESKLGAWGDKCHVMSPLNNGKEVAAIDFHTIPRAFIEIQFQHSNHHLNIAAGKQKFDAGHGLGSLHWKGTGMEIRGKASWELRDEQNLLMSVDIDENQANGLICLWRRDLSKQMVETLVVAGIAQIEEYKRMLRTAKVSAFGAIASAGWLAAA